MDGSWDGSIFTSEGLLDNICWPWDIELNGPDFWAGIHFEFAVSGLFFWADFAPCDDITIVDVDI